MKWIIFLTLILGACAKKDPFYQPDDFTCKPDQTTSCWVERKTLKWVDRRPVTKDSFREDELKCSSNKGAVSICTVGDKPRVPGHAEIKTNGKIVYWEWEDER